jgi:histidinol-phosphate aminotransferase
VRHLLSLNENPMPPLPSVAETIRQAASEANRYPEFYPNRLRKAIAHWQQVPEDSLIVAPGSVAVALHALQASTGPGRSVVYGWRNFDAYPLLARMANAPARPVPLLPGGHQNLDGMAQAAATSAGAVIVCNPHNPTGQLIPPDDLERFLTAVPRDTVVLLDEAYIEFAAPDHRPDHRDWIRRFPHLLVLRTFSKAYGLAGLRVGYGMANPQLAARIRAYELPFALTSLAAAAAEVSLHAEAELHERVRHIVTERDRLAHRLRNQGWHVLPSHANFLWLDEPQDADRLGKQLAQENIVTRAYPGEGLRLTVGNRAANDAVLDALRPLSRHRAGEQKHAMHTG